MTKTQDQYFVDWESFAFGFGYGTGEPHLIPVIKDFLEHLASKRPYDYREIEAKFGPVVGWMMINKMCELDVIEYGTSPRGGWLTEHGQRLADYVSERSAEQLIDLVTEFPDGYIHCYPDACNCGPQGYDTKAVCDNPFWEKRR